MLAIAYLIALGALLLASIAWRARPLFALAFVVVSAVSVFAITYSTATPVVQGAIALKAVSPFAARSAFRLYQVLSEESGRAIGLAVIAFMANRFGAPLATNAILLCGVSWGAFERTLKALYSPILGRPPPVTIQDLGSLGPADLSLLLFSEVSAVVAQTALTLALWRLVFRSNGARPRIVGTASVITFHFMYNSVGTWLAPGVTLGLVQEESFGLVVTLSKGALAGAAWAFLAPLVWQDLKQGNWADPA
jgi:hypothetical protein